MAASESLCPRSVSACPFTDLRHKPIFIASCGERVNERDHIRDEAFSMRCARGRRESKGLPYNESSTMPASLETILAATRRRVAHSRKMADRRALERAASEHSPRGFRNRLRQIAQTRPAVIAELKKASPSKGLIRADFEPSLLARELEKSGAAALSVLTDEQFFQGSLGNLKQASAATSLPCLRKDFIVDEFQILEARANRADAILLIAAALSEPQMLALIEAARRHELDVLCEAHNEEELRLIVGAGCDLIGINSRNLQTFQVDPQTLTRLAGLIPTNCVSVAESGIDSGVELTRLMGIGYDAFLIGEFLMKAERPGAALAKLIGEFHSEMVSSKLEARS